MRKEAIQLTEVHAEGNTMGIAYRLIFNYMDNRIELNSLYPTCYITHFERTAWDRKKLPKPNTIYKHFEYVLGVIINNKRLHSPMYEMNDTCLSLIKHYLENICDPYFTVPKH